MSGDTSIGTDAQALEAARENERLVGAILGGDRDAEQACAQRFMRPVKAMLLARSRNPDIVPDLLQDVMIELICALRRGQLREPAKLPAFVSAVARNVLNNHFRGSARQPDSLELPDDLPDLSTISNQWEDQEKESRAMKVISSLEPLDRKILQMTLVDGLKPGVIAERLGVNPDVVRQRKLRATRRVIDFFQSASQKGSSLHIITGRRT